MKFNHFIISGFIIFLLASCSEKPMIHNKKFKHKQPDFLKDNDIINPFNADNKIYTPKKSFVYSYKFINKDNKEEACITYFDSIERKRVYYFIPSSEKKLYKKVLIEELVLSIFEGQGDAPIAREQTVMKYEYKNGKKYVGYGERTGIIEDSTRVFVHPPRQQCFTWTALHPFPEIRFPLEIGKIWYSTYYPSYEVLSELKLEKTPTIMTEKHEIISKQYMDTELGNIECFVVRIEGIDENTGVEATTIAHFNTEYGFVKIEYSNNQKPFSFILNLEKVL